MASQHREHEQALEVIVQRLSGARVEHVDDGSSSGMFDALMHFPDGSTGALELTTLADPAALEMASFGISIDVDSPNLFHLRYPGSAVSMRHVRRHVPMLVMLMDQLNLEHSDQLLRIYRSAPAVGWLRREDLELRRIATGRGGRVDILPEAFGGAVDTSLSGLTSWIVAQQTEPWWSDNVAKLERSGLAELHLALRVHMSRMPFPLLSGFGDVVEVASPEPPAMEPLTGLWIVAQWSPKVVSWTGEGGWQVHEAG